MPKVYINPTIVNHFSHPNLSKTNQNCTLKTEGQKNGVQQNLFGTCDSDNWWSMGLEGVLLQGILYLRLMRGGCSWYILKIWVQDPFTFCFVILVKNNKIMCPSLSLSV